MTSSCTRTCGVTGSPRESMVGCLRHWDGLCTDRPTIDIVLLKSLANGTNDVNNVDTHAMVRTHMGIEKNSTRQVQTIPTPYAVALDTPLIRRALIALLNEQTTKYYQAAEEAMRDSKPCPDRKEYELDRLKRLLREVS